MIKFIFKAAIPVVLFVGGIIGIYGKVFAAMPPIVFHCPTSIYCPTTNPRDCHFSYPFNKLLNPKPIRANGTYLLNAAEAKSASGLKKTASCLYTSGGVPASSIIVQDSTNELVANYHFPLRNGFAHTKWGHDGVCQSDDSMVIFNRCLFSHQW